MDPVAGEETELVPRIELLSNVEGLRAAAVSAGEALASESDDPMQRDAGGLVDAAVQELERVASLDPRVAGIAEQLRSVSFQIADAAKELAAYASDLDEEGPGELARANDRLAQLTGLFRFYGATSEEVLAHAETASQSSSRSTATMRRSAGSRRESPSCASARPHSPPSSPSCARPRPSSSAPP